jgi:arginase
MDSDDRLADVRLGTRGLVLLEDPERALEARRVSGTRQSVTLLGLPYDGASSFLSGPAGAPDRIREALASAAGNLFSELGPEITEASGFADAGDVAVGGAEPRRTIEDGVRRVVDGGARVLCLGGDHSVTYPAVRAHRARYPELTLVHFDAHPDLYDSFEGVRYSLACPFARIMEEGLADRLIQIGIRAATDHQRQQAERFGVETFSMSPLPDPLAIGVSGPVYVSFDLDALDPAFAPGVSHPEPGGMSTRAAISLIHRLGGSIVGADVVELNPDRDPQGLTAVVAAKLVKELAARMILDAA